MTEWTPEDFIDPEADAPEPVKESDPWDTDPEPTPRERVDAYLTRQGWSAKRKSTFLDYLAFSGGLRDYAARIGAMDANRQAIVKVARRWNHKIVRHGNEMYRVNGGNVSLA